MKEQRVLYDSRPDVFIRPVVSNCILTLVWENCFRGCTSNVYTKLVAMYQYIRTRVLLSVQKDVFWYEILSEPMHCIVFVVQVYTYQMATTIEENVTVTYPVQLIRMISQFHAPGIEYTKLYIAPGTHGIWFWNVVLLSFCHCFVLRYFQIVGYFSRGILLSLYSIFVKKGKNCRVTRRCIKIVLCNRLFILTHLENI